MEKEYLTIKEAAKNYNVSSSTITRFARGHQKTKFVKKEKGRFLVSDSLLSSNFEKAEIHEPSEIQTSNQSKENDNNLMVATLKSENEFLRSQSIEKDKQINTLLQRQFEQNSIIQTLQNRIENIGTKIDNSVLLISNKVKENKDRNKGSCNTCAYSY